MDQQGLGPGQQTAEGGHIPVGFRAKWEDGQARWWVGAFGLSKEAAIGAEAQWVEEIDYM